MNSLIPFAQAAVYLLMAIALVAALGVVTLANIFYAALCLVGVLIATAGIFLAIHAEFLAVIQILLYVGAVMTIVIFAIMLTNRIDSKWTQAQNGLIIPALFICGFFFSILANMFCKTKWPMQPNAGSISVTTLDIGKAFLGQYVFPFEVISIILIVALVGALIVAKKDKEEA